MRRMVEKGMKCSSFSRCLLMYPSSFLFLFFRLTTPIFAPSITKILNQLFIVVAVRARGYLTARVVDVIAEEQ